MDKRKLERGSRSRRLPQTVPTQDPPWLRRFVGLADDSSIARSWWAWVALAVVLVAIAGAAFGRTGALAIVGIVAAVATVRVSEQLYDGRRGAVRAVAGIVVGSALSVALPAWGNALPTDTDKEAVRDFRGMGVRQEQAGEPRGGVASRARPGGPAPPTPALPG